MIYMYFIPFHANCTLLQFNATLAIAAHFRVLREELLCSGELLHLPMSWLCSLKHLVSLCSLPAGGTHFQKRYLFSLCSLPVGELICRNKSLICLHVCSLLSLPQALHLFLAKGRSFFFVGHVAAAEGFSTREAHRLRASSRASWWSIARWCQSPRVQEADGRVRLV